VQEVQQQEQEQEQEQEQVQQQEQEQELVQPPPPPPWRTSPVALSKPCSTSDSGGLHRNNG
jgi:hypothetical protein